MEDRLMAAENSEYESPADSQQMTLFGGALARQPRQGRNRSSHLVGAVELNLSDLTFTVTSRRKTSSRKSKADSESEVVTQRVAILNRVNPADNKPYRSKITVYGAGNLGLPAGWGERLMTIIIDELTKAHPVIRQKAVDSAVAAETVQPLPPEFEQKRDRSIGLSRFHLLKRMGYDDPSGSEYERLEKTLLQLRGLTVHAVNAFFDPSTQSLRTLIFGLIEYVDLPAGRLSRGKNSPDDMTWITVSETLWDSIYINRNFKPFPTDFWVALHTTRETAGRIFKLLHKREGLSPAFTIPLVDLATMMMTTDERGRTTYEGAAQIQRTIYRSNELLVRIGYISKYEYQTINGIACVTYTYASGFFDAVHLLNTSEAKILVQAADEGDTIDLTSLRRRSVFRKREANLGVQNLLFDPSALAIEDQGVSNIETPDHEVLTITPEETEKQQRAKRRISRKVKSETEDVVPSPLLIETWDSVWDGERERSLAQKIHEELGVVLPTARQFAADPVRRAAAFKIFEYEPKEFILSKKEELRKKGASEEDIEGYNWGAYFAQILRGKNGADPIVYKPKTVQERERLEAKSAKLKGKAASAPASVEVKEKLLSVPPNPNRAPAIWMPVWDKMLEILEQQVSEPTYKTHICSLQLLSIDLNEEETGGEVVIQVPSHFTREWMAKRHVDTIASAIAAAMGNPDLAAFLKVHLVNKQG